MSEARTLGALGLLLMLVGFGVDALRSSSNPGGLSLLILAFLALGWALPFAALARRAKSAYHPGVWLLVLLFIISETEYLRSQDIIGITVAGVGMLVTPVIALVTG